MHILIDSWSTQALYQHTPPNLPNQIGNYPVKTGHRLRTVIGALEGMGISSNSQWVVSFCTPPITAAQLANVDVYISFTRYFTLPFAYTPAELKALQNFVSVQGGGILLLTNHGPFSGNPTSWPINDVALAQQFGITLTPNGVSIKSTPMTISPGAPSYLANQVQGIMAHDSCIIKPPATFTSIATFPPGSLEWNGSKNVPPSSPYFSILVPYGKGNVIVVGNSGMMADYGTPSPSCGLVPMQSNLMFFLNCVGYLGGLTQIPAAGQCPS